MAPKTDKKDKMKEKRAPSESPEKVKGKSLQSKVKKTKPISRSIRAGVHFPVSRIQRTLRDEKHAPRVGITSAVHVAAAVEYIIAEILDLAIKACVDHSKVRIVPRHLMMAIRNDDELDQLLSGATLAHSGVIPKINAMLLPKKIPKANQSGTTKPDALSQEY